ncbi:MAG TPA: PQQ-dependent sugar dehydrogenase, partial [Chondromyces sp.]|nr:PQQ-dependent sugar dehydrogenase [Chondromyces sp.]
HSYYEDGMVYNRIVQVRKEENEWQETLELLAGIPGGSIHNGGRLAFSPDGKLFATAGDAGNPENAQSLDTLAGKILRVNTDGSIPDDNPFARSYIYSYGHRNPQGLAWAEDGTMYSTEHGQRAHDEINLIKPGKNYGWPIIQGDEQEEGMERPIFHSGEETWAPSGMSYDSGTLYVAALRGQKMLAFNLETKEIQTVYNHAGRLRGILISGHFIYFITNNTDGRGTPAEDDDKLMKISLNRQ